MKVKVDKLSQEISFILEDYAEEVRPALQKAISSVADRCLKRIRAESPRKTGAYAKGWTKKAVNSDAGTGYIIYNKDKPWLAHLLEFGHAKKDGGRTKGIPHISPAVKEAGEELDRAIGEALENL